MQSPSICSPNKGFTLIEVLVVLAILGGIFSLGIFANLDAYRAYSFRSQRDMAVSLLTKARSRAMANIGQTPWGVCYLAPDYILFQGSTCVAGLAANETTQADGAAGISGFSGVVFSQVSGTSSGGTIVLTQDWRTATITVNYEGTIDW